ncbi:MAG: DUF2490 domain-containing protein [Saprospiraceae bacterium]|nr:DUF2490 domain-containing protein [Saprospiraceae bacterium]
MRLFNLFSRKGLFWYFLLTSIAAQAQLGSWNILHLRYQPGQRLTLFGEAQLRSLAFYHQFHYYEIKGGISWKLNDQIAVTGGAGRYDTYQAGGNFVSPKAQQEIRSWLEIGMRNHLYQLNIDHRYRAEQRFTKNGYRNRFRYRLGVSAPLYGWGSPKKELFASVWNEIFLTNRAPYFERNRSFLGLVLRSGAFSYSAGWVHQFDYRLTDEIGRSFLQLGCQITLGPSNKEKGAPEIEEN